jgi:hypothetical protein
MKILHIAIFFFVFNSITAIAQLESRVSSGVDLGLGYQDDDWVPSVSYHQELSLNNFEWFRIGWGIRTSAHYAGPSDLYPQKNGFSSDYLKFGKLSSNSLSFMFGANFRLWRFDIGANTDIVNISVGIRRKGLYTKNYIFEDDDAGFYNQHVSSKPRFINAIPLALQDHNGQSELYLRYWISNRVGIKLGYFIGRTTYQTSEKLDNGHKLFSRTYGVPAFSIALPLND